MTTFDQKCRKFGIFIDYKSDSKIVKISVISIVAFMSFIVSMPVTEYFLNITIEMTSTISFGFQFFYMYYCTAEIFLVCRTIRIRSEKINDYFKKTIFHSKKHTKQFLKLLNELCDLIDHVNSTFTLNVIFVLANILAMGTIGLYTLIVALHTLKYVHFWFVAIYTTSWIGTQFGLACFIAHVGNSVNEQFYETFLIAIRRLNSSLNESINDEMRDLILELRCRNRNIECVFFRVDWSVIFAVSRYLINKSMLVIKFLNFIELSDGCYNFHILDHHLANL